MLIVCWHLVSKKTLRACTELTLIQDMKNFVENILPGPKVFGKTNFDQSHAYEMDDNDRQKCFEVNVQLPDDQI